MANPGAKAPTLLLDSSAVTLGGEKTSDISVYHIPALDVPAERPDMHVILLPMQDILWAACLLRPVPPAPVPAWG